MFDLLVKNFTEHDFLARYNLSGADRRVLNAGSSSVRYNMNCVNVDIRPKRNVDVICDIHNVPALPGQFDAIVCNAVLQYCQDPHSVALEFHRILKSGGYLFLDAPWIQPFCQDTVDRFRFSEDALKSLFSMFEIIEVGPSIRPGSAFAMLGVHIAGSLTANRYINWLLRKTVTACLFPFRWIRTVDESNTAGAFYMICKKSE